MIRVKGYLTQFIYIYLSLTSSNINCAMTCSSKTFIANRIIIRACQSPLIDCYLIDSTSMLQYICGVSVYNRVLTVIIVIIEDIILL